MPSYARQTLDTPNPIARFAHRRRYAASLAFTAEVAGPEATVLDYGCGEGDFLKLLSAARSDLTLVGYDPFSTHEGGGAYRKVNTISDVKPESVDVLTCFETLEHLDQEETRQFLAETDGLLTPGGVLVVSVPIIGGPPLLLKEANRLFLHRRVDYRPRELAAAAFLGRPASRAENIKFSHKGWDFRPLAATVAASGFQQQRDLRSPFPRLPWWLNSQMFYVFGRA